jgi:hypothetical protein
LPKLTLVVLRLTPGAVPVPLKLTTWGVLLALSLIVTEPVRRPVVVGVKVTSIVHVALDATEPPV